MSDMVATMGIMVGYIVGTLAPGAAKASPALSPEAAAAMAGQRPDFMRPHAAVRARFEAGQRVRSRNMNPTTHTRLPRYARGKQGTIARCRGVFVFPDTNAHGLGEQPQPLYSVRFAAPELWGDEASWRDSVYLDLWEPYLEHA